MTPSQRAIEFLWGQEIDTPYRGVTWPGGASGVTVGGFYDLGQQSAATILADWAALPSLTLTRFMSWSGAKGALAQRLAAGAQTLDVPELVAREVFSSVMVPRYALMASNAFPNCHLLTGDSFGALVSLVFNRGASMGDPSEPQPDSRAEMRLIRDAMAAQNFDLVPGYIRAMQRLWPDDSDLWRRRAAEADLFTAGLHPSLETTT